MSGDDVIRIRIDTACAVGDFLELLGRQSAEGETRAPAKPANRAVFRELAPYLLVEYEYVDPALGKVDGVYVGFPDGTVYAASEEIPETLVDDLVAGEVSDLAPLYVYLVPGEVRPLATIDNFLDILARHMGHAVVGVMLDGEGRAIVRAHAGDDPTPGVAARLEFQMARAAGETARHLSRRQVLDCLDRRNGRDGRAYALFHYDYGRHVVVFDTPEDRDDFVAWCRTLFDCLYASPDAGSWGIEGLSRPAEPCAAPVKDVPVTPLPAPKGWNDGSAWAGVTGEPSAAGAYWGVITGAVREVAAEMVG